MLGHIFEALGLWPRAEESKSWWSVIHASPGAVVLRFWWETSPVRWKSGGWDLSARIRGRWSGSTPR